MGTSATIKIEGLTFAKVYKHSDGDRTATLPWLKKFNEEFTHERGEDPLYKFAQLLRSSERDGDEFNLERTKFTGWGIVPYDDTMGAEFEYTLKKDGKVTVRKL